MTGSAKRPNILIFMTDQQRADHLSCAGNTVLRTPNIDSIAARGVLFDRCYVASPSCMPNRSSFMTMRMPSLHGVRQNGIPLPRRNRTFVDVLRTAGYHTAMIGKSHLQNMQDLPPRLPPATPSSRHPVGGFEEAHDEALNQEFYEQELPSRWADPEHRIAAPFYGFEHVELCNDHGDLTFGDYDRWLASQCSNADQLRGPKHAEPCADLVVPQAWRTRLPEEFYSTSYIAERAQAFLKRQADESAPFLLLCSFPDPHHPFTPPGRYWDLYDPAKMRLPPAFAHAAADWPRHLAWLHNERMEKKAPLQAHRVFAIDEAETRQALALTYAMISMVDDMIGRIMAALAASDLADQTIVIFTSDHGDLMGDHGLLLKGPLHYDGLIRVPLIWSEPGTRQPIRTDALCSTLDIGETILDRLGLAAPNGCQGQSLAPILDGRSNTVRDALLIEEETARVFLGFENPVKLRTLVTADNKRLSFYAGNNFGEFYDRNVDPNEFHNRWEDPMVAPLRASLMERMTSLMIELTDRSPLPTRLA